MTDQTTPETTPTETNPLRTKAQIQADFDRTCAIIGEKELETKILQAQLATLYQRAHQIKFEPQAQITPDLKSVC